MAYTNNKDIHTFANAASASIAIELINQLAKSQLDDKDATSKFINNLNKATRANAIRTLILAHSNLPGSGKKLEISNALELAGPTAINLGLRYVGEIALVKTFSEKIGYHTLSTYAKEIIMNFTTHALWTVAKYCMNYKSNISSIN